MLRKLSKPVKLSTIPYNKSSKKKMAILCMQLFRIFIIKLIVINQPLVFTILLVVIQILVYFISGGNSEDAHLRHKSNEITW